MAELSEQLLSAGVVGAGGAGFPAHIKAKSKVEIVLANGAECEPLIHKDYELMINHPKEIVEGMKLMIASTNAAKGIFGIKEKNTKAIEAIKKYTDGSNIEISLLGDFYPSGDEYELVYHATKRLIPPRGIPLDVGCVVNNVESLYNIYKASQNIPVTEKFVCVTGLVKNPSSFFAPIGTTFRELIEHAGGAKIKEYAIFVSGILMGKLSFDDTEVVTKTTAGIIILPREHYLVKRQERPQKDMNKIGRSACDQCSYCTEFCPRYLLGYDVQPHKVMRTLVFTKSGNELWNQYADLCCSCGLCSLYACPEDLYPREACDQSKQEMRKQNFNFNQVKPVKVHPIKDGRRVPLKQLMKKLDLLNYDCKTPFKNERPNPSNVKIYLKQHVGKTAEAIVTINQKVEKGDLIAKINEKDLGSNIHSPISGIVTHVSDDYVRINTF